MQNFELFYDGRPGAIVATLRDADTGDVIERATNLADGKAAKKWGRAAAKEAKKLAAIDAKSSETTFVHITGDEIFAL